MDWPDANRIEALGVTILAFGASFGPRIQQRNAQNSTAKWLKVLF